MSTTITLQVKVSRLQWKGREFKRGDIIRYHSHFGYWRSDFYNSSNRDEQLISQVALDNISTNGWMKVVSYRDYWSAGVIHK